MHLPLVPTLTLLSLLVISPSIVFAAPSVIDPSLKVETVFEGLNTPSNMAFLDKDTILVLEKNTGIVDRVVNGSILSEPLLDVNVSNALERGLLGVAIAKSDKNITRVFLYFTESKSEDGKDECNTPTHCKVGNDPLGNRLYRYDLVSNKLINPKLLLSLPSTPGPAHNGGIVKIGPDNNVYVVLGELGWMSTQASNVPQKKATPDGRGGILRVTEDGQPLQSILGNDTQLNLYYAYGIRNSFGLDFDPVTGNLWDTENGPSFGDEINLVKPGFNSGWSKMQGVWEVTRGSMGKENTHPDSLLLNYGGKGVYSPPEFTWKVPVAPTAIKFFPSDKLGRQYSNDLFVGGGNNGNIYDFDLNENGGRTELLLHGSLADRVANNTLENEGITWGKGFGIITDMRIGPSDGYLYILSINLPNDRGTIFRIVPVGDS
jgi:glucose/arabinose dehydrogenase